MTDANGAQGRRPSTTAPHASRLWPAVIRRVGLPLAVMLLVASGFGCSELGSTPSAQDELCSDLSDLQDSLRDLVTVEGDDDLTTVKDEWDQVKTDFDAVKSSAEEVTSASMDPVITSFNELVTAVQGALSAPSVSAAVSSIQTAATNFTDALNTAVSELKCSS